MRVFLSILGFIGFIGLILALDYSSLLWYGFMAPKREAVRREVWENTRSFNEGKRQELVRYMHQYNTAKTADEKRSIASVVRMTFAGVDTNDLPPELRSFLSTCFNGVY